ncbi:MAG: hypothetical protein CES88_10390 [Halobacteriovorax sp. JY17]|nr:MAG: hypothetical protein CES88_10390 [Halobacteriovorax sp. JY17]
MESNILGIIFFALLILCTNISVFIFLRNVKKGLYTNKFTKRGLRTVYFFFGIGFLAEAFIIFAILYKYSYSL